MDLIARYPRAAAWIVCVALVGAATAEAMLGLALAAPAPPPDARRVHGVVVAVQPSGVFALRVAGHAGLLWFRPAAAARISPAHLRRHLRERAGTDVVYEPLPHALPLAWSAD